MCLKESGFLVLHWGRTLWYDVREKTNQVGLSDIKTILRWT